MKKFYPLIELTARAVWITFWTVVYFVGVALAAVGVLSLHGRKAVREFFDNAMIW